MNCAARISILSTLIFLLLPGCGDPLPPLTKTTIGPGIGPFDARGNYREDWADDPSKWRRPTGQIASVDRPPPNANPLPPSSGSVSRPISGPTARPSSRPAAAPISRPTPKPVARPSVRHHTVKRGDTLSAIASRYRSSVTAIRRANNISGSLIRPGQRLLIPGR